MSKPFPLQELVDLIKVRDYVVNATGNPTIDRATVSYINGALIMLDKKIIGMLSSSEFKAYIDYGNVKQTIQEVANITNIKSSLNNKKV